MDSVLFKISANFQVLVFYVFFIKLIIFPSLIFIVENCIFGLFLKYNLNKEKFSKTGIF